ncbi:tetratricopeptide repeat protein [Paraburkholderia sp. A1RO-5L]
MLARQGGLPASDDLSKLVELAWDFHKQSKLDEAEAIYRLLYATHPNDVRVLRSLGILASNREQHDDAIRFLRAAIDIEPDNISTRENLADAHRLAGDHRSAIEIYRDILKSCPSESKWRRRLTALLSTEMRHDEAVEVLKELLSQGPDDVAILNQLGCSYLELKQHGEAAGMFRRVLALHPDDWGARVNLANALFFMGDLDAARIECDIALAAKSDAGAVLLAHGNILLQSGKVLEAITAYEQAAACMPEYADVYANIGNALAAAGRHRDAVEHYFKAVKLKSDHYTAYVAALFHQHYDGSRAPYENLAKAKQYGSALMANVRPYLHPRPSADEVERRLRVGFVSGDLKRHPVSFFLESVLKHLDRHKVEPVAYSLSVHQDEVTERIKPLFQNWQSLLGLTPQRAAEIIRQDRVDILIDLHGHTTNSGLPLFAWKPAPIQANWIGYFASTGLPTMDYIIGDRYTLPENEEGHFVERPWRLPRGYLCFQPPSETIAIEPPPSTREKTVTFGCFNNLLKMDDQVVLVWARLLRAMPNARLFLKTKELDSDFRRESILKNFEAHGVGAGQLLMEGVSPRAEYLARYNQVDVALDPFPYNGGTTTVEALWMGVPVIVLRGDRFVAHMGEGILHHLGHPEWIADDEEDYVAKAVALANHPQLLADIRSNLRGELLASPLCDGPGFAQQLGEAFLEMWRRHCEEAVECPVGHIEEQLRQATSLHQSSRFEEAARIYFDILRVQPNHVEANMSLGLLAMQQKRPAESLPFFKTALEAEPKRKDLWSTYIDTLRLLGHHDAANEAIAQGQKIGISFSDSPPSERFTPENSAIDTLAQEFEATFQVLEEQGDFATLLPLAQQMTALIPDRGLGWKILGKALNRQGRMDEALKPLTTAATLLPTDEAVRQLLSEAKAYGITLRLAKEFQCAGDTINSNRIVEQLSKAGWAHGNVIQPDKSGVDY